MHLNRHPGLGRPQLDVRHSGEEWHVAQGVPGARQQRQPHGKMHEDLLRKLIDVHYAEPVQLAGHQASALSETFWRSPSGRTRR